MMMRMMVEKCFPRPSLLRAVEEINRIFASFVDWIFIKSNNL